MSVKLPTSRFKTSALPPRWRLVRADPPGKGQSIVGQFHAEEYVENVSTEWAEVSIPTRSEPVLQWAKGNADTAAFRATLYAETAIDDIDAEIRALKAACRRDEKLARPPVFLFVYGAIEFTVVVTSVGGIRYDELWADGRARRVTFDLALRAIRSPYTLTGTDPTARPHLSRYKPFVAGDTYESLALREYGDPIYGVWLRQDAMAAFPGAGAIARLPAKPYFDRRTLAPVSKILDTRDPAVAAAIRELIDTRAEGEAGEYPMV